MRHLIEFGLNVINVTFLFIATTDARITNMSSWCAALTPAFHSCFSVTSLVTTFVAISLANLILLRLSQSTVHQKNFHTEKISYIATAVALARLYTEDLISGRLDTLNYNAMYFAGSNITPDAVILISLCTNLMAFGLAFLGHLIKEYMISGISCSVFPVEEKVNTRNGLIERASILYIDGKNEQCEYSRELKAE